MSVSPSGSSVMSEKASNNYYSYVTVNWSSPYPKDLLLEVFIDTIMLI